MKTWIVAILLSLMTLTACKDDGATTKLAVQYAAIKYMRASDDSAAEAEKVRAVIEQIRAVAKGESVTVAALKAYATGVLPADMYPEDRLLAHALIDAVAAELEERVGAGVLLPEQLVQVDVVLGWIVEATSYVAP